MIGAACVPERPRVSVVIPFYNAASSLGDAVASLQRQHEAQWELVAVEDGSTDRGARNARERTEAQLHAHGYRTRCDYLSAA